MASVPGRIEMIDVVRGGACLWVILHHGLQFWGLHPRGLALRGLQPVAELGFFGVHVFLCVSGFVLFYPLARKAAVDGLRLDAGRFLRRRARRILPPYYAALALFLALCWASPAAGRILQPTPPSGVALHVLMLFNLHAASVAVINTSFWSLALEFQLYLAFPLLVWATRRWGLWPTVLATLVVAVAWQNGVAPRMVPPSRKWADLVVWYYAVPGRCFEFAMGMAAAAAVAGRWRWRVPVAAAAVALLAPVTAYLGLRNNQCGPAQDQLAGVASAGLLVLAAAAPASVARRSAVRLLGWVGGISYSVYLLHAPLLQLTRPWLDRHGVPDAWRPAAFFAVAVPALVALGFAFHLAFERPFMSAPRPAVAAPPVPVEATDPVLEVAPSGG